MDAQCVPVFHRYFDFSELYYSRLFPWKLNLLFKKKDRYLYRFNKLLGIIGVIDGSTFVIYHEEQF
jgi:hypothetical protein